MRARLMAKLLASCLTTVVFSLSALANTPPSLSTVSNSPEAPLGNQYFGGAAGQATVSAGGNAVYQLPIELPPGTGESTPSLRLVYNSNVDNGLLGLGWFLQGSDSKITRCPQTMAQDGQRHAVNFTHDDRFCLNGNRLIVTSGTYGYAGSEYATESDQFSRVVAHGSTGNGPSYFTVETKSGHLQYFGNTTDSAVDDETTTHIRVWRLNRDEDRAGNYSTVTYHEDSALGESYPTKIEYSGNDTAGVSPNVAIDFEYEARSDNIISFQGGSTLHKHPERLSGLSVKVAGVEAYRHDFSYTEAGLSNFSRLSTVEHCDAANACKDPVTISWKHDGSSAYSASWLATLKYRGTHYSSNDQSASFMTPHTWHPRWHDVNGDGRADYLLNDPRKANRREWDVRLSSPTGYTTETWTTVQPAYNTYNIKTLFGDVNADGKTDLVVVRNMGVGARAFVSLSTGSGFVNSVWGSDGTFAELYDLIDMNGDQLPDLVSIDDHKSSYHKTVYKTVRVRLNTGSSFDPEVVWATSVPHHVQIGEFNGDGLPDLIVKSNSVRINDGTGFGPEVSWGAPATAYKAGGYWTYHVAFSDYNGDGLMDRQAHLAGAWQVQLNNGVTFQNHQSRVAARSLDMNADRLHDSVTYTSGTYVSGNSQRGRASLSITHASDLGGTTGIAMTPLPLQQGYTKYSGVGDVNGDGFLDASVKQTNICYSGHINWFYYNWYCETINSRIFTNQGDRPNLVSAITEPSGREVNFEYDWLASGTDTYTKGTGAVLPELDIQDSTRVVKRMRVSDGLGGDFETTYEYEGLKWNLDGRGILGFAKIVSTNADTGIETTTEYEQSFPLVMQPKHVEQRRVSDGRLLAETDTTYTINGTLGSGPVFPYVSSNVEKQYALVDGRLLVTTTTSRTVDAYGNTLSLDVETDDTENAEVRKQVVNDTYSAPDLTNWRVGELANSATQFWLNGGMSSADTRTTSYTYGSTYGLLKSTTREPSGGVGIEVTTTRTHDSFGNVLSETIAGPGLASRTTTIAYDVRGQFPQTLTNALGHTTTQAWDSTWGKKTSQTDANGQTTTWAYDSFGNQTLVTRPDGTTLSTMTYEDPLGSGVGAAFYQEVIESGKAPRRTFVDLLGRTVRERSQSFDGSYVNVDSEYDSQGRLYRQSEPYFDGTGADWNTFGYDDIGRVTSLVAADAVASSTTSYSGFSTTVTDSASRSETQVVDAAGRVKSVTDKAGTPMSISYDAQGNRLSVTAAAGTSVASTVTYSYDRYGRLTQQDDPDHGVYSYTYDALGNKLTEVSPEMAIASPAQSRSFAYDLLGRLTSRTEPEGTASWTYDDTTSGNLGIGKVNSESQAGFSKTYTYAAGNYGRLTNIQTSVAATSYNESKAYDSNGMLLSETFPASVSSLGGYTVEYTYNALGYLERAQESGGSKVLYQTLDTNAAGRVTQEWLGDGSTVTNTFDGVSARVTGQLSQAASIIQQFSYAYDASGNMLNRTDNLNALSESFSYDNLDRLTNATVAGQSAVSYAFDEAGSITQKSDLADTYDYIMGPTHAVTLLTQGGTARALSYDTNGNFVLGTGEPTVVWSSYNKPIQLSEGSITYDFDYGPDRGRYRKKRNTETTHYVGNRFEHSFGGTAEIYRSTIFANGRAIMIREDMTGGASHKYLHRDHLGSVTAITDESTGNVLDRLSYDAWGQRRIATTWVAGPVAATDRRGYTGHEHLDDIGIIHMNGRIYSPNLGRMLSPDPVTQAPENGQNYNRYTYAFNNPLRYTDPSGYSAMDDLLDNDSGGSNGDPHGGFNIVVGVDYPYGSHCGGSNQSLGDDCNHSDTYLDYLLAGGDYLKPATEWSSNGYDSGGHAVVQSGDVVTTEGSIDYGVDQSPVSANWWAGARAGFSVNIRGASITVDVNLVSHECPAGQACTGNELTQGVNVSVGFRGTRRVEAVIFSASRSSENSIDWTPWEASILDVQYGPVSVTPEFEVGVGGGFGVGGEVTYDLGRFFREQVLGTCRPRSRCKID